MHIMLSLKCCWFFSYKVNIFFTKGKLEVKLNHAFLNMPNFFYFICSLEIYYFSHIVFQQCIVFSVLHSSTQSFSNNAYSWIMLTEIQNCPKDCNSSLWYRTQLRMSTVVPGIKIKCKTKESEEVLLWGTKCSRKQNSLSR